MSVESSGTRGGGEAELSACNLGIVSIRRGVECQRAPAVVLCTPVVVLAAYRQTDLADWHINDLQVTTFSLAQLPQPSTMQT